MKLEFAKYHGAGNDFIIVDGSLYPMSLDQDFVKGICDRHKGVGADGFILVNPMADNEVGMRYFNSDGSESSLCGNGGRCVTAWANAAGLCDSDLRINASDGLHKATIISAMPGHWDIKLRMRDTGFPEERANGFFIDSGSPHHIAFVKDLHILDVHSLGAKIRYSETYAPAGTNVDFVEKIGEMIHMRTYERGVENETLACGTGVTAAVLTKAYLEGNHTEGEQEVDMPGGRLSLAYRMTAQGFTDIWLRGPAVHVFSGQIEI